MSEPTDLTAADVAEPAAAPDDALPTGDLVEELRWRGLLQQSTDVDALRSALAEGPVTYYCGFDPTAPSLHHGHLVQRSCCVTSSSPATGRSPSSAEPPG